MNGPGIWLRAGATLLALLGIARGAGGVMLLVRGRAAGAPSPAPEAVLRGVGVGLLVVALLALVAAVQLFRGRRAGWTLGVLALVLFLAGGLVNGALLFGRPTDAGTIVNAAVAALAFMCLTSGRSALRSEPGA